MDNRYGGPMSGSSSPEIQRNTLGPPDRRPSLEDHVAHIQRVTERLSRVRSSLDVLADRIELRPEAASKDSACPSPQDLSSRLAFEAEHLHRQCDYIERQVERIFVSLFSTNQAEQRAINPSVPRMEMR
jgi:hypothetical protein